MGRQQPLFGRGGAWGDRLSDAVRRAAPGMGAFQNAVYRAIVSKRRMLALSLVANIVLLALLVFKSAPQPALRRESEPCIAPLILPQQRRQQAEAANAVSAQAQPQGSGTGTVKAAAAGAAASGSSEQASYPVVPAGRKAWLVIGIPSAPRPTPYLMQTLESLLSELPDDATDPLYGRVRVIVMDTSPGRNHAITALRGRIRYPKKGDVFAAKAAAYLEVIDSPRSEPDPTPNAPDPDDLHNPGDRPGRAVRSQTRNLVELLTLARHRGTYYLFMEDDFRVCPFMLRALHYTLAKAHALQPAWLALRLSYGMNGVLLRATDLDALISYFRAGIARKPPDILWREWSVDDDRPQAHKDRPLVVYRYNLLAHVGAVSSFPVRMARPAWPGCYHPMNRVWSLHLRERYNAGRCTGASDISPCSRPPRAAHGGDGGGGGGSWLQYQLRWPASAAGPPPHSGSVGKDGRESSRSRERGQQQGGSWLGSFFSRGSDAVPRGAGRGGGSDGSGSRTVFRDNAFETNFGRGSATGGDANSQLDGDAYGSQLDGDVGIGGSLGTAYALD